MTSHGRLVAARAMLGIRYRYPLSAALAAITAAVFGVIASRAIWFGLHTLIGEVRDQHVGALILRLPVPGSYNVAALVMALAAIVAMFRFKIGMIATLLGCAVAGIFDSSCGVGMAAIKSGKSGRHPP
jgi:chromate transporter